VKNLDATPPLLPRYLTARQLAETLQCCPQTVRNWYKRGLLPPPLLMGRRKRLWDVEAVRAALARLQGPAAGRRDGGKEEAPEKAPQV
jgi:predicted DNA-binding transcriptional regulator AlpA